MSVREANRVHTRMRLAEAAADLFMRLGYDAVTMADIATQAGVSRRTAFRYFGSKDELLLEHPKSWMVVFDDATHTFAHLPIGDRLRAASQAIANHIESNPTAVKQAFAIAGVTPALAASYAAASQLWIDRVAREIEPNAEASARALVKARLLASAVMGMIDAVCQQWAVGDEPMGPLLDMGFDLLDTAFAEYG